MKFACILATALAASLLSINTLATTNTKVFPLDHEILLVGYSGGSDLTLNTSCVVNRKDTHGMYSYTIKVSYETKKQMLLTWNFLDWILSQYPNAIMARQANAYIFPLKVGKGEYVFRFKSKEGPLRFEQTTLALFPVAPADAQEQKQNVKINETYSGVAVSSHDYVSASVGLGASSCLPADLLVFPQGTRSGF